MNSHIDRISALKKSCIVLWKDLNLLASLYLAHFIVWRAVRRRRREDAARRGHFKLLNGGSMRSGTNKHESVRVNSCDFVDRFFVRHLGTTHEITRSNTKSLEIVVTVSSATVAGHKGG